MPLHDFWATIDEILPAGVAGSFAATFGARAGGGPPDSEAVEELLRLAWHRHHYCNIKGWLTMRFEG